MSREDVEIVRRGAEAVMRQPEPDWETVTELFAPDHEFFSRLSPLEGDSHVGASGFAAFREALDATGDWGVTIEDVRAAPDGRVVVISRFRVTTYDAGVALEEHIGTVVTVRDGLIRTTRSYATQQEALEAVGLRE